MATEQPIYVDSSKLAYVDLDTKQYHFVKETANGIELCSAATDRPAGILQNDPKAGESAQIMRLGKSKLVCGGTIALGDQIGTDNAGKGDTKVAGTDTTNYVVGSACEGGAVNEIISVVVDCMNVHRAA